MPTTPFFVASGGLSLGGSADVASSHWSYVASGGLNSGGSSDVSSTSWGYTGKGGLRTSGQADAGNSGEGGANGGASFGGSADVKLVFNYVASGGLGTGQSAPVAVSADIITTFTWDVSEGVLRNWRVLGKCTPANHPCPPTNVKDNGCPPNGSTMQFMMNVQAHSLTDLCQRLRAKGWIAPIQKIQVWSQPVFKSDWSPGTDPSCNTLTTVDFSKIPDCFGFLVDQDLSVTGAVTASVIFEPTIFSYEASGGLGSGGAVPTISSNYSYEASGGFGFGGSAVASSPQFFHYIASGGLGAGSASFAQPSDYGIRSAGGKFSSHVLDVGIVFGAQAAPLLTPSQDQVPATCCTALNLPQILFVKHDLNRSQALSDFLKVNGLTLDPIQKMMYSRQKNAWFTNLQYRGMSIDDQKEQQIWNIVFEFGCLTENALLGVPSDVWGFSILLRKRSLSNSRVDITRLVLVFDPLQICSVPGALRFDFTFNTNLLTTSPPVVRTVVFLDELSSFNGKGYKNNPNAVFEVSASTPDLGAGMFDQTIPLQNVLLGV